MREIGTDRKKVSWVVPAVLIAATASSIMSMDLYAPTLPHLTGYFGTDSETVKLTMSLNLIGFSVAQLAFGPLADRFGRRPVILWGMGGFPCSACFARWPGRLRP